MPGHIPGAVSQVKHLGTHCRRRTGGNARFQQELAEAWGIDASQIFDVAGFLRRLGYEIRNHHTNPQIERDNWLIPYAFPTLTNLSVQLRKKLRG